MLTAMTKNTPRDPRKRGSARWSCHVETLGFRRSAPIVRTVFAVEQQSFILAEGSGRNPAEMQHCEFIRDMFIKALGRIGVFPSPPKTTEGKVISLVGRKKRIPARTPRVATPREVPAPKVCDHGTKGCGGWGETCSS